MPPPLHHFLLGGQKSGKSRRAEGLAQGWLAQHPGHRVLVLATAQPGDAEMRQRIARHQADRAARLPGVVTLEVGADLAAAIQQHSSVDTLLLVDCLTLWLTQLMSPPARALPLVAPNDDFSAFYPSNMPEAPVHKAQVAMLLGVIEAAPGPLVLVGNEIGLGVIPLGGEVRAFVDALGQLNQAVAQRCAAVTLMVAGLPVCVKEA